MGVADVAPATAAVVAAAESAVTVGSSANCAGQCTRQTDNRQLVHMSATCLQCVRTVDLTASAFLAQALTDIAVDVAACEG